MYTSSALLFLLIIISRGMSTRLNAALQAAVKREWIQRAAIDDDDDEAGGGGGGSVRQLAAVSSRGGVVFVLAKATTLLAISLGNDDGDVRCDELQLQFANSLQSLEAVTRVELNGDSSLLLLVVCADENHLLRQQPVFLGVSGFSGSHVRFCCKRQGERRLPRRRALATTLPSTATDVYACCVGCVHLSLLSCRRAVAVSRRTRRNDRR